MRGAADCPFCLHLDLLEGQPFWRGAHLYAVAHPAPHRADDMMVMPYRHVETPEALSGQEFAELPAAIVACRERLGDPAGLTVGWNVGESAGQHVAHVHMHVIARPLDDPAGATGIAGVLLRARKVAG